ASPAHIADEQGVGRGLQRTQRLWRQDQCQALGPADRDRPILADGRPTSLSALRAQSRDGEADECRRQRAVHGAGGGWAQRGADRGVRRQYHYNFWRPITAIRNGDIDDNPATDREATWQPIDNTPMHPEYPCAHCILSGSVAGVVKAVLGTAEIPEIAVTSATAPSVTHRWTNMTAFTDEVANARIWAGFHYRFS